MNIDPDGYVVEGEGTDGIMSDCESREERKRREEEERHPRRICDEADLGDLGADGKGFFRRTS